MSPNTAGRTVLPAAELAGRPDVLAGGANGPVLPLKANGGQNTPSVRAPPQDPDYGLLWLTL